jgi:DNA-binding LacI/PurR family transcriptional regulator/signal transduction histidine kinase
VPNLKQAFPSQNQRLTLGFLSYHENNESHNQMMAGILKAAQKYDASIIQFGGLGKDIGEKELRRAIKTQLEIIKDQNLDGLMFLGWFQFISVDPQEFLGFLKIPLFSLGARFATIPSVYADGGIYLREELTHLIEVHQCRKIAYISPVHLNEVLEDNRVQFYRDVMKERGIYDPQLLVSATELSSAGIDLVLRAKQAVSILFDERKLDYDAIVSSYNDETINILAELNQRGIKVPDDIKLVGYEDDVFAKYAEVPITTIYYPFWELGYCGCERFIQMLTSQDQDMPFTMVVPGRIILRRSCGCISNSVNIASTEISTITQEYSPIDRQLVYRQIMDNFPKFEFDVEGLFNIFMDDLELKTNMRFLRALEEQLAIYQQEHPDASGIEDFISYLRKLILPYLVDRKLDLIWAEDLWHQARITLQEKAVNLLGMQELETNQLNQMLHKISQELITTFHTQKLMDLLELSLPQLNIPSCYLFLFTLGQEVYNDAIMTFKYVDHQRIPLTEDNPTSLKDLLHNIPQNRRYLLLSYLLSVSDEYLGVVLFEPGPLDERIYFTLSVLLSTAVKGAILVERLQNANLELTAMQQELVETAHKAGMADVATGTLHNVGNVLNSINTSLALIRDIIRNSPLDDFKQANDLLRSHSDDLKGFIANHPKGEKLLQFYFKLEAPFTELHQQISYHINRLMDRISLVNEIIVAQQNYASNIPTLERIDLSNVIDDALKMQSVMLDKYQIKIIRNFKTIPQIMAHKNKLLHILINLFNNAKDAMLDTPEKKRQITLTIEYVNQEVSLYFTDTGQGIPPEFLKSIFRYGFTTKQEGHGFGLHSCANYMTEMGGSIWAESPGPGKGATMVLQFKVNNDYSSQR